MSIRLIRSVLLVGVALALAASLPSASSQAPGAKITPKLEPIAETKLLMEGMTAPNFRGLDRLLATKPADAQTWKFARGQALLIAETANLLMLRPPRNQGQPAWFDRATELRTASTQLAQSLAKQEYEDARGKLVALANACNRCHQTFRIPVEIAPFTEKPEAK